MKPTEKLPDLLEFFNIIARIQRLNEVFRLSGRIRYLYEVLCFILIIFDAFFLFITVIFNLRPGSLEGIATFDVAIPSRLPGLRLKMTVMNKKKASKIMRIKQRTSYK